MTQTTQEAAASRGPPAKSTLICTVKNEAGSARAFLESLLAQSRLPDEIVIVDGGSTDDTVEILRAYADRLPLRVLVEPGANISRGRNLAVAAARNGIIVGTDMGCRLDTAWFERIVRPFETDPGVGVVSGWFEPDARTPFEQVVASMTHAPLERAKPDADTFLPSSRSIAFRKDAWSAVGGYPEHLYTGEDTLFDINLRKAGYRFALASDAVVYWRMRDTYRSLWKQYFLYAKGDAEAGLAVRAWANGLYMTPLLFAGALVCGALLGGAAGVAAAAGLLALLWYARQGALRALLHRNTAFLVHGAAVALVLQASAISGILAGLASPRRRGRALR